MRTTRQHATLIFLIASFIFSHSCTTMTCKDISPVEETVYVIDDWHVCSEVQEYQQVQSVASLHSDSDGASSWREEDVSVVSDEGGGNLEDMSESELAVINIFSTTLAGETFIPGIYRILARWPLYLKHVANELGPLLHDPVIIDICEKIADRVFYSASEIWGNLDLTQKEPPLNENQKQQVLAAIAAYRGTSPQMVGFGTLLLNALPTNSLNNR